MLSDHERKTLREVERQFMLEDPGFAQSFDTDAQHHKVNMQIVTMPVPAQDGITRDNVTVEVDAVVYYKVVDPVKVIVDVQNYDAAIGQVAQASLRSIIGKSDLDDLLSNRERLNQGLELMIDRPALDWGVHIDRVEIKDVASCSPNAGSGCSWIRPLAPLVLTGTALAMRAATPI